MIWCLEQKKRSNHSQEEDNSHGLQATATRNEAVAYGCLLKSRKNPQTVGLIGFCHQISPEECFNVQDPPNTKNKSISQQIFHDLQVRHRYTWALFYLEDGIRKGILLSRTCPNKDP